MVCFCFYTFSVQWEKLRQAQALRYSHWKYRRRLYMGFNFRLVLFLQYLFVVEEKSWRRVCVFTKKKLVARRHFYFIIWLYQSNEVSKINCSFRTFGSIFSHFVCWYAGFAKYFIRSLVPQTLTENVTFFFNIPVIFSSYKNEQNQIEPREKSKATIPS